MSREDAHRILDAARRGSDVPERLILEALVVTGDLAPWALDPQVRAH